MSDFPKVSEGIMGEYDVPKSNTELFLNMVKQYFPEAIKDGEVDFTALKEEMGEFEEIGAEHYSFTWAGKQAAKKEAQADLFGRTLNFKPEDSVNADTTENIYIEGDNLEALKLLRRNYYGKIKMIYIDPPYNTGNDFVYRDNFTMTEDELAELSGDIVDGERLQKNSKDSAKYHTNWLNMMYPRLKIARDLLKDDGVIFISIDDNEVANLKKICDEVFGTENFATQFIWTKTSTPPSLSYKCRKTVEYVLCYEKNLNNFRYFGSKLGGGDAPLLNSGNPTKDLLFPVGSVCFKFIDNGIVRKGNYDKIELLDDVIVVDGKNANEFRMKGEFKWGQPMLNNEVLDGTYFLIKTEKLSVRFQRPYDENNYKTPNNFLNLELNKENGIGTNESAVKELGSLGLSEHFDFPKPISLIAYLINMVCKFDKESIILDFFSGSATTAHAVMQLNAEDGGHRKFIMAQYPEETSEKSEAYKAGYKNICEIGKERIRRAAKKIHEDNPEAVFDDGFKVFEIADTNIRWNKLSEEDLDKIYRISKDKDAIDFTNGYKDIDVVYEIMLRQYGIPLSTPIETLKEISERTYIFADSIVVCLDDKITDEIIEKLADIEPIPAKYILRDSAFEDDIEFKDTSYRRLSALIANHQTDEEKKNKFNNFTVEFI